MKDEREILTRDIVQQKLIYEAKRFIIGPLLIWLLGFIVMGLPSLLLIKMDPSLSALAFVFSFAFIGLTFICLFKIKRGSKQLGAAKCGNFVITQERLTKMEDYKLSIWQTLLRFDISFPIITKDYCNHIFEFESGKKFVVNAGEYKDTHIGTVAQFSQVGDELIVVSYINAPEKIVMLFSPKIYNYKA